MKSKQTGFAHLALILLLVVVAVIAFAGYKVVKNQEAKTTANQTSATTANTPTINSSTDLDKAAATLNSQSVDGDLNPDSLNSDVSSLL
jgi:uncharacterized protein HemX